MENWKEIQGFPGYEVSNSGRIRSFWGQASGRPKGHKWVLKQTPQRILTQWDTGCGYWMTKLYRNGKRYQILVHRIVLTTFIGPCPAGHEVCHNDGERSNNHVDNLRWDTKKGNWRDRRRHKTACIGEKHGGAKLTEDIVKMVRQLVTDGYHQKDICERFSIPQATVSKIVNRKTWAHV